MAAAQKILVLGANGFIGSHLVDSLAAKGLEVIAFDRYSKQPQFIDHPNVTQLIGDIFESNDIANALEEIDYVLHAFSATTPYSSELDPYSDINENLANNVKIFDMCVKRNVKKIIYISSGGAIYGASSEEGKSAKETDVALTRSPYGISKLATERYLDYFHAKYGIQHVSYRLSNPYGPRQITKHNQGVIPRFIEHISGDQTISIYGDGSSSRDYIYIEDAAKMIVESFMDAKQTVYNVGSGQQTSLAELISNLEELLEKQAVTEYLPEPTTFVHSTKLDVSRIHDEFDLGPRIDLRQGLLRTIDNQLN